MDLRFVLVDFDSVVRAASRGAPEKAVEGALELGSEHVLRSEPAEELGDRQRAAMPEHVNLGGEIEIVSGDKSSMRRRNWFS